MNANANEQWPDAGGQLWATTALEEHMGDTGAGFRSLVAMRDGGGRERRQGSGGKASEAYPSARAGEEHGRRVFARGECAIAEWFSLVLELDKCRLLLAFPLPRSHVAVQQKVEMLYGTLLCLEGKVKRYWSLTAAASYGERMRSFEACQELMGSNSWYLSRVSVPA